MLIYTIGFPNLKYNRIEITCYSYSGSLSSTKYTLQEHSFVSLSTT